MIRSLAIPWAMLGFLLALMATEGQVEARAPSRLVRDWVAQPAASPEDARIRMRLDRWGQGDASVVVRGDVGPNGSWARGIRVRLARGALRLERFDSTGATELDAEHLVSPRQARKAVVVEVLTLGADILAQVFSAADPDLRLASLAGRDTRQQPGGGWGIQVVDAARRGLAVKGVNRRPACDLSRLKAGEDRPRHPFFAVLGPPIGPPGLREGVSLDTLERHYCAGGTIRGLDAEVPRGWLDSAARSCAAHPLLLDAAGRVDLDMCAPDAAGVEALLRAWHARFPDRTELREIGRSHEGRPLLALTVRGTSAAGVHRPALLLNGAHHGLELASITPVLDAVQQLLAPAAEAREHVDRWLGALDVVAVPLVNPDGLDRTLNVAARVGRKNGRPADTSSLYDAFEGVDLNRNYPFRWGSHGEKGSRSDLRSPWYRGPEATSEPETRAMMALAMRHVFVGSVSYHSGNVAVLAPYTIRGARSPEPNEAWTVAEGVVDALNATGVQHPEGRSFALRRNLYTVDGTDQDWHRFAHGTVALLVEVAARNPQTSEERAALRTTLRPSWTALAERFVDGPSVVGRVVDAEGRPVAAEVRWVEQKLHEEERWSSRCPDGLFARYLPARGKVTLRASLPDGTEVRQTLPSHRRGLEVLELRLPHAAPPSARCQVAEGAPAP